MASDAGAIVSGRLLADRLRCMQGSLVSMRPRRLGGVTMRALEQVPALNPHQIDDLGILAAGLPGGESEFQHGAASSPPNSAYDFPLPGTTVNRYCSSLAADHADGVLHATKAGEGR